MKKQWMLVLVLAASAVRAENVPGVIGISSREMMSDKTGQITLSWEEFQKIWEELQKLKSAKPEPRPAPPVDYVISKAHYGGRVENGVLDITATLDINVLKDKSWVRIPILPSDMALREVTLDDQPVAIETAKGFHALLTQLYGRHTVTARFSLPYPRKDKAPSIDFSIAATAMTLLELELPQSGLDVRVSPSQGIRTRTAGGKTYVTAALPPTEAVHIEWQKAGAPERPLPAKVYVETQELVTVEESALSLNADYQYSILHSPISDLRLELPKGLNILSVSCDNMKDWKVVDSVARKILQVSFIFPQKDGVGVHISAQLPMAETSVIEMPRIKALDVEREEGSLGVEARGAIEIKMEASKDVYPLDVKELPEMVWRKAKNPILLAYKYARQPYSLALNIQRHQDIAVLTTTVDSAHAVTLFIKEGLAVTHASYQVRNHLKQFMAFELPEGSEVWSAFVNQQLVKPVKDKQGKILVPLIKSGQGEGAALAFSVDIIYCTKTPRFSLLGFKRTEMPVPDVPVSQMLWSVYFPSQFRFVKFWGDMDSDSSAVVYPMTAADDEDKPHEPPVHNFWGVRAKKGAIDALSGVLNRAMQQSNQAAASYVNGGPAGAVQQAVARQAEMEENFAGRLDSTQTGVLPVAFNIPESGRLYRFGKILIVGENPQLKMIYLHFRIIQCVLAFLGSLLVWGGLRQANRILEMIATTLEWYVARF